MPDPAGTHTDGSLQFGSQVVTIGSDAFVATEISYELGTKELTRRNQYNVPEAEVLLDDIGTGSMTLQLPASDTVPPERGDSFTLIDAGGASLPMKLSKIGRQWKQDDLIMLKVDFRQKLN